ncbi:porin [Zoogloea sp.]|uniref:porin n=1 Tax=Zoogloea sp. TaxID=49181 RepID=UPI0026319DAD|nr:porin [Zoogloea sp.]MDD3355057.1 porin [Zoogloea sp.]
MKKTLLAQSVALALAAAAGSAQAVSFTQNDVTIDINGTINGFYVNRESKTTIAGGPETKSQNSALSNGLLPGWINFVATTKHAGQDIKAHFSFAPGINDSSEVIGLPTNPAAGATGGRNSPFSQIDVRNVYFQFGNNDWGTLKFGRDIGLFGQNIILSDMTLLGVGGTSNAGVPYNTTFGMIGHGYMYTGFQAQITYTTPNYNGLQASAGIFQPSNFGGDQTKTPGFQAEVDYDWKGGVPGKVWGGLVTQSTSCSKGATCDGVGANPAKSFTATGYELGAKAGINNFEAVAYAFAGKGLGMSTVGAQFYGGSDGLGNKTDSKGYFLQGTYKFDKTKVGINFGQNKDNDGVLGQGNERKNKAYTLGVYHSLNKFITLVGELNQEKITSTVDDSETKNRTISAGAILFF